MEYNFEIKFGDGAIMSVSFNQDFLDSGGYYYITTVYEDGRKFKGSAYSNFKSCCLNSEVKDEIKKQMEVC